MRLIEVQQALEALGIIDDIEELRGRKLPLLPVSSGGSPLSRFIQLQDTPASYKDQAGKILQVNAEENRLEFTDGNPGDITAVLAGYGLLGGGISGDVTLALDTDYTDARYVNVAGDTMTGKLSIIGSADELLDVDSGAFRFHNTTEETHLVIYNANPGNAISGIYLTDNVEPTTGGLDYANFGAMIYDVNDNWGLGERAVIIISDTDTLVGIMNDQNTGGLAVDPANSKVRIGDFPESTLAPADIDSKLHIMDADGTINIVNPTLRLTARSEGTVTTGFGTGIEFELEGADGTELVAGHIHVAFTDVATGTEDSDMIFGVSTAGAAATEKVRITSAGRVGIGTDSPDSAFHIKAGLPGVVGSHSAGQLIIQSPTDSVFSNVVITAYESDGDGNPDQQLWYLGNSSSGNTDIIFLNRRNAKLALATNGTSRITILGNGNVGIGVASPLAQFHVKGLSDEIQTTIQAHSSQTANILEIQDSSNNVLLSVAGVGTLDIITATDPQLRLTHTDGVDETDFYTNSDGELVIMPTARTIYLGDGTDGDSTFGFWGDTSIFTLIHTDDDGTLRLSANDVTNYAQFAADGELTLVGTARVMISMDLEPVLATRPAANPPGEGTEDNFATHDFNASTDESVYFHLELPHDYAAAGTIHIHFDFFVDTAPASAQGVVWGVEYKKQSIGDNFDFDAGTTIDYTTTAVTTGTPANDKKVHQSAEIDLTTTGFAPNDYILLRLFRDADGTGGTDDFTADARVIDYHIEYLSDKLGEAT